MYSVVPWTRHRNKLTSLFHYFFHICFHLDIEKNNKCHTKYWLSRLNQFTPVIQNIATHTVYPNQRGVPGYCWYLLGSLVWLRSHTWFCCSSDKFGILLELDVVIALVLHQHHLQIDVITYLELPHTPVSLLVQGHCCSHVAVVCISCTHTYTHSVKIKKKKRIKYRHIYRPLSEC